MCGQAADWIVMSCNVKFKLTNGMQLNGVNGVIDKVKRFKGELYANLYNDMSLVAILIKIEIKS